MCFKVNSRKQKIAVASLAAVLVILALYCLVTKTDKIMVLYNLLYYTVFIALTEEFVVRGVCVDLLRTEKSSVRYLVPNILFAAMHIFSYAGWGELTFRYLFSFVSSQMLGLIVMGCLFQYLKENPALFGYRFWCMPSLIFRLCWGIRQVSGRAYFMKIFKKLQEVSL